VSGRRKRRGSVRERLEQIGAIVETLPHDQYVDLDLGFGREGGQRAVTALLAIGAESRETTFVKPERSYVIVSALLQVAGVRVRAAFERDPSPEEIEAATKEGASYAEEPYLARSVTR